MKLSINPSLKFMLVATSIALVNVGCSHSSHKKNTKSLKVDSIKKIRPKDNNISGQEDSTDCLTKLVLHSNFPFDSSISKAKIRLSIDEEFPENSAYPDSIRARVYFETDGTGTLGWIMYHLKDRKLVDISANLPAPHELKFDHKYADLLDECLKNNAAGLGIHTDSLSDVGTYTDKGGDMQNGYVLQCALKGTMNEAYLFLKENHFKDFRDGDAFLNNLPLKDTTYIYAKKNIDLAYGVDKKNKKTITLTDAGGMTLFTLDSTRNNILITRTMYPD